MPKCIGIGLKLPHRLPISAGVYPCSCSYSITSAVGSVPNLAKVLSKWSSGGRAPRRLVLGLGASFWAQLMNMSGAVGGKAFTASARLKSGPSFEEVVFQFIIGGKVLFFIVSLLIWFLGFLQFWILMMDRCCFDSRNSHFFVWDYRLCLKE